MSLNTPFKISPEVLSQITYGLDLMNDKTSQSLVDGRVWVPDMNMVNFAPYLQTSTNLFRDLTVKAGLRVENINIDVDDFNTLATGANGAGSIAVQGGHLNYNALVFNAGARYSAFKIFNPFISYAQSFSVFELGRVLRAAKSNTLSQLETKPIIVNNYEAGFSSTWGKLNMSAAYYYSTSKLRQIHLWLGLGTGLIVFVISMTGCLYVFEAEIRDFTQKDYLFVPIQQKPFIGVEKIIQNFENKAPKAAIASIKMINSSPNASVSIYTSTKEVYYFNPYDGHLLKRTGQDWLATVQNIHINLLLGETGKRIAGFSVLIFVILLLTGLVLWFPGQMRLLKQSLTVKWKGSFKRVNRFVLRL